MIPVSLAELTALTGGALHPDTPQVRTVVVDGPVVTDSREAAAGSLYIARIGEHQDGHAFVGPAAARGAVAALTSRPVPELPCVVVPDVQEAFVALTRHVLERAREGGAGGAGLTVIGVTGSSGKTTTKDLLAAVLSGHAPTVANVGSLNSEVGVPLTACRVGSDTRYLVLEMGARGIGHIRYLTGMTAPTIGVVLNVGTAHVGEFGSRESIATAKGELVEALPASGLAVLNADDPLVVAMAPRTRARVVSYGRAADAQVRATQVSLDATGRAAFQLAYAGESAPVRLVLLGEHQVENALAAAAVALHVGMTLPDVAAALARAVPASRWRMECVDRSDGLRIVNDAYNANPDSMAAALRTVAGMEPPAPGGRRWAALGEMLELGLDGPAQHAAMGELAARLGLDEIVAVGPGAEPVAQGARDAGLPPDRVRCVPDVDAGYALLDAQLRPGDLVLVKSSHGSGLRVLGERLSEEPGPSDKEVAP